MNTCEEVVAKENLLRFFNFVFLPGGQVKLGTKFPLPCKLEGYRHDEIPERILSVQPFWLSKFCVSNSQFEQFNNKHLRPFTSLGDKHPATEVTYLDALSYAAWASEKYNLSFRLPTELEWTFAAAPLGWEFPYQEHPQPVKGFAHTFDRNNFQTIEVDDQRFGANHYGLYHMGGNVSEITAPWYQSSGHNGAESDGAYYIAKGGNFGHCVFSAGVQRKGIVDVSDRSNRIGFRLAHSA